MGIAVFLFLLSPLAHAASASDPAWRALLHFTGSRSSVRASSPFFLSPSGSRDPAAELAATEKYFAEQKDAPCRFPARALYLGKKPAGASELCTRWDRWRAAIRAEGAELVFAAAYLSSPSSMYGHTLLKFARGGQAAGEDLLDYTLNYGAKTGDTIGLPYVWQGLTGGFDGSYATTPFYLKVREYNFVENRDFWIYPLKLSADQLALLEAHAWELRDVDFPYYFLHKNCAYYLLELLEVLRPGENLLDHFPFWTVPVDTIRLLAERGWLGTPRYKPSRYRRLKEIGGELKSEEVPIVEQLALSGEAGALPVGREALLLDAAYELWRYRTEGKKSSGADVENKLLSARAPLTDLGFHADFSKERPPELGHPSSRAGVAYGENRQHSFFDLHYRGTLQDLLANPHGYENHSELSMGDLRVRAEHGKIFAERFDLLRLRSVAPGERWIPRTAWSFRAGYSRAKEFHCEAWACARGGIEGGFGKSLSLGPLLVFALAEAEAEGGSVFDRGYRVGGGPSGGLFLPLWRTGRLLVEGEWHWRLLGSDWPRRAARLGFSQELSRIFEARLQLEVMRSYSE